MSHYRDRYALLSATPLLALLLTGSAVADPTTQTDRISPNSAAVQTWVSPATSKGFNPQPEPPAQGFQSPASQKGFHPQPDPPRQSTGGFQNPVMSKGFNPQPEPPAQAIPGYQQPSQGF